MNDNVAAFLRVVRAGETNQEDSAYRMMFGGRLFDSFTQHPNIVNTSGDLSSTAAGAYQFLYSTWKGLVAQNHYTDFSPSTQDHAAVQLIKGRGAYEDVIAGRFEDAVRKCNKEWASLPGSPYGQPTMSMAMAREVYERYGGTYGLQEGQETTEKVKEKGMIPVFFEVALQALSAAIPAIAQLVGGEKDKRNAKVGQIVVDLAKDTVGAVNEQELIQSLKSPESVSAIQKAVEARWFELVEAGGGGIAGARKAAAEASGGSQSLSRNPAFIVTLLLLPMTYIVLYAVLWGSDIPENLKVMTVTAVISGVLNGIMGYWLGTSMSSAKKDDQLFKAK